MTLYRETPCEHGLLDAHDWYTSKPLEHGDVPWPWFDGDCPGGSRTEVVIDYEAALLPFLKEHRRYHNIYDGDHPNYPLDLIRVAVDAALKSAGDQ